MVTQKIKELEATKEKIVALERSIAAQLSKELASLHEKYGFESVAAFTAAVRSAVYRPRSGRVKRSGRPAAKAAGKRRRAVITDATRASVKKLVEAGKTGGEIAKSLRISLPSVQNIKKALGLTKARK